MGKALVLGVGAQGSAVAERMGEHPNAAKNIQPTIA